MDGGTDRGQGGNENKAIAVAKKLVRRDRRRCWDMGQKRTGGVVTRGVKGYARGLDLDRDSNLLFLLFLFVVAFIERGCRVIVSFLDCATPSPGTRTFCTVWG